MPVFFVKHHYRCFAQVNTIIDHGQRFFHRFAVFIAPTHIYGFKFMSKCFSFRFVFSDHQLNSCSCIAHSSGSIYTILVVLISSRGILIRSSRAFIPTLGFLRIIVSPSFIKILFSSTIGTISDAIEIATRSKN